MSENRHSYHRLVNDLTTLVKAGVFMRTTSEKGGAATDWWNPDDLKKAIVIIPDLPNSRYFREALPNTLSKTVSDLAKYLGIPLPGYYRTVAAHRNSSTKLKAEAEEAKAKVKAEELDALFSDIKQEKATENLVLPDITKSIESILEKTAAEKQSLFKITSETYMCEQIAAINIVAACYKFQGLYANEVISSIYYANDVWI